MNVNNLASLLGNSATSLAATVGAATGNGSTSSIPPPMAGASTASISTPGQFMSEMQQLSQQNPTEFKSVAAQVATAFQNAASQASGPEAKLLTSLANMFSQAAQTGTLQPPQGPGSSAASSTSSSQTSQSVPDEPERPGGAGCAGHVGDSGRAGVFERPEWPEQQRRASPSPPSRGRLGEPVERGPAGLPERLQHPGPGDAERLGVGFGVRRHVALIAVALVLARLHSQVVAPDSSTRWHATVKTEAACVADRTSSWAS